MYADAVTAAARRIHECDEVESIPSWPTVLIAGIIGDIYGVETRLVSNDIEKRLANLEREAR